MNGKVLWHVTMSLDGYIAGPNDEVDWVFRYPDPNPVVDDIIAGLGAVLVGRRSYEVGRKPGQAPEASKVYGGAWTGPMFVLTHEPPPGVADPDVTFLSGDIRSAVATVLEAAGGKNVVIIGAAVARACIEAGLVDEIVVHLAPILLGDGVRFFGREGAAPKDLETIGVSRAGQVTNLRFRVMH